MGHVAKRGPVSITPRHALKVRIASHALCLSALFPQGYGASCSSSVTQPSPLNLPPAFLNNLSLHPLFSLSPTQGYGVSCSNLVMQLAPWWRSASSTMTKSWLARG